MADEKKMTMEEKPESATESATESVQEDAKKEAPETNADKTHGVGMGDRTNDADKEEEQYRRYGSRSHGFYRSSPFVETPTFEHFRRKRRRRMYMYYARCVCAALAALLLAALCIWFCATNFVLLKTYKPQTVDTAVYLLNQAGGSMDEMIGQVYGFVELAVGEARVVPEPERSRVAGRLRYARSTVDSSGSRARMALVQMERTGDVLRGKKLSVDLSDADAMLSMMENGAARLNAYTLMAAEMMADAGLWAEHGEDVLDCLREMADSMSELSSCMQALMLRRLVDEDDLLDGDWGDGVFVMLGMSEGALRECGMNALSALAGVQSRLDVYDALMQAVKSGKLDGTA